MLSIKNLTKVYGGTKTAVSDLSIEVEAGDIYGFIGHNGAGKSTTIKCVVGIVDFDGGEITVNGHSIKTDAFAAKSDLAFVPDNPDIYEYLTGIQYLNFIADIFGVSALDRTERIKKYGDMFEITSSLGDLISSYSHGMKQKTALMGALIHNPKLLILDEPFVGLDPKAVVSLKNVFKELCAANSAIFFSTHVLDVAEKLCNKIAIIKDGKLVVSGKTGDLTKGESLEEAFMEIYKNV